MNKGADQSRSPWTLKSLEVRGGNRTGVIKVFRMPEDLAVSLQYKSRCAQ